MSQFVLNTTSGPFGTVLTVTTDDLEPYNYIGFFDFTNTRFY